MKTALLKTLPYLKATTIVLLTIVCLLCMHSGALGSVHNALLLEDQDRIAKIRVAGLTNDRTQIPILVKFLKDPPHEAYYKVVLHALAQMGATEALPQIQALIMETQSGEKRDLELNNFARVAKARLLAESSVKDIKDNALRASGKIARFYTEIGLTPDNLNTNSLLAVENWDAADVHPPLSLTMFALREIADMAYRGSSADYASLPGVLQVNFARDDAAALKMRLASLSPEDRIVKLVEELGSKKILSSNENLEIQLLADEGTAASRAAAAKIRDMSGQREKYPSNGFGALFQVIGAVGDQEQIPLVEQFNREADARIIPGAELAFSLSKGRKRLYAFGY